MNITPEQHIENWKGLYDNAIISLKDCKRQSARTNQELLNENRGLSMKIIRVEAELEKYKSFFRDVQSAQQALIKKL